ncbi:Alanine racemase 1 [Acaryochloris thomasi RCC1774]|uniref:Alanine racemase n=1 Tax=Acaryochloris thomasi RCC1774 TaxID=1764569 RepID=A0A2W1JMR2_9CYAN|nr:alanine racemase [Acaryochloris thomasi]PZD74598.1 Alanine racemase 1 [Acaryochloris thomasi RCC1774]
MPTQPIGSLFCERAWITIDLDALAHNARQLKKSLLPQTELMAVVKADGYGHGAATVARTVLEQGVTWLAVATILEGKELRQAGITAPILLLGAVQAPQEVDAIASWQLQPTLCSPKQALAVSQYAKQPTSVHINIDTGMSRLGPLWQQGAAFIEFVATLPNLQIASIYSHFATADDADSSFMETQQSRFQTLTQQIQTAGILQPKLHLANSAGTLSGPQYHYDLVRVGLALYGLYPEAKFRQEIHLQPVMQLKARVTQIKTLLAGTGVSYGHTYVTPQKMKVAVVGIGYADGVPRPLSNRITALIRGQRVQQIGSITMDQLMIDVSQVPNVGIGDVVTLLGQDGEAKIPVETWADLLGTISYEIVCGFKPRLPRVSVMKTL